MPVPAVSPKNWERTTIICHFVTATSVEIVEELSFEDRVASILDRERNFTSKAVSNEQEENHRDYKTHSNFQATPRRPYRREFSVAREKPHRPRISDETLTRLREKVKEEKPSVPAERLDFDDNLGIVLDAAERYYKTLQCELRQTQPAE